jgi:hypothetical protein
MVIDLAIANTPYSRTVISHRDFQDTCYTIVTDHGTTIGHNWSNFQESRVFDWNENIHRRNQDYNCDLIMVPTSRIEIIQKKYGHEFPRHIANSEGILVVRQTSIPARTQQKPVWPGHTRDSRFRHGTVVIERGTTIGHNSDNPRLTILRM